MYDCTIIGGGPAGMNAALVLGRAKRKVLLIDSGKPRNRVAHASHGYLTRDGIQPAEFRRIAMEEVLRYPSVEHQAEEAVTIKKVEGGFEVQLRSGKTLTSRKLILATGLKEVLPDIDGLSDFYGNSLFNCPFCDGWEHRDQPLILVSDHSHVFHITKLLYNWSKELYVCTNGKSILDEDQKKQLEARGIAVIETSIERFTGQNGQIEQVHFADGSSISCQGGLITSELQPTIHFHQELNYEVTESGGIVTNEMGKTTIDGVFAAGDSAYVMPSQLIFAAASGSKAAAGVLAELVEEDWRSTEH